MNYHTKLIYIILCFFGGERWGDGGSVCHYLPFFACLFLFSFLFVFVSFLTVFTRRSDVLDNGRYEAFHIWMAMEISDWGDPRIFRGIYTALVLWPSPPNSRLGFQSWKCTVAALLTTMYDWVEKLESGKEVCSVFSIQGKCLILFHTDNLFRNFVNVMQARMYSNG